MRALFVALFALLPLGAAAENDAHTFEVSHVRVGLACIKTALRPDQDGWVCHPTKDVYVVDQGTCVYDKRKVPCTWTGVEFDYKGAKPGAKLVCTVTSGAPTIPGNPDTAAQSSSKQFKYELPLERQAGHRFEAQYVVFELHEAGFSDIAESAQCTMDGRVIFSYDQVLHFPTNDD